MTKPMPPAEKKQVRQMVAAYVQFKKSLDELYIKRRKIISNIRQNLNQSGIELLLAKLKKM